MSDIERPWVERRRSGPPTRCPVCGAATMHVNIAGVITCGAAAGDHFEWRPDPEPVVSVESERADRMRCISCHAQEDDAGRVFHKDGCAARVLSSPSERADEWKCSWCRGHSPVTETRCRFCDIERPGADNQRYDKSLTIDLPSPRPDGYHCTHEPRCRDRRAVGDPEWSATEMACGRVELEQEEPEFTEADLRAYGTAVNGVLERMLAQMNAAGVLWGDASPRRVQEVDEARAKIADHLPCSRCQGTRSVFGDPCSACNPGGHLPPRQPTASERRGDTIDGREIHLPGCTRLTYLSAGCTCPPHEGEIVGVDYRTACAGRLAPDVARFAALHRPLYGSPPTCAGCRDAGQPELRERGRIAWPCATAGLALGMMGLTASDIAITSG